ncbi:dihydrodipicolinate synthase family protein [Emticicia sp. BO119]|uniref:dihydrodipicolinate synthase family protein n=1 Tax=Emticicia sp. BO119 TaxID=2757768 RepID=UPI0015EFF654|nr:dihydrodipicolinate synthase family protein [Emticicia sp. BO119]MBA4848926.1 dihydrodipicolinate synthase family protein [Emticicia sp. BO119]
MKQLFPLSGIVTVLNTPFDTQGNVDLPSLRTNVQYAIQAGVAGFLVPALASEVAALSIAERLQMVAAVTEEVAGEVLVFAGAGEPDKDRRKYIVKKYLAMGCRNILFQIPFENEEQFKSEFYELADLGVETIMLQDWSANGYGLPDDLILELFHKVEAFRCLKVETVPAGVKYSRLLSLTEGRLHLSGGWAVTQMIEGLKRGIHAFMPTGMHKTYCAIYQHFKACELTKAEQLFYQLLPVLAFSNQHLDISIHFFKRLLHRQRIYKTPNIRASLLPFDAIHEGISERLIEKVIALEESL